ncbi:15225_t:CDS:2 [Acaulospora colombiana]|uniref:15225_t:CDS:1 n=1 Tax=Acaulospora colombiana TaxID=27376 RepID=A0ACA9K6A1_9GLOM|nr:15225_t:CDS:2 [Acaulospora colombiana]
MLDIAKEVAGGRRETPVDGTPVDYWTLYESAWDKDPNERPDIEYIRKKLDTIRLLPTYTNDQNKPQRLSIQQKPAMNDGMINKPPSYGTNIGMKTYNTPPDSNESHRRTPPGSGVTPTTYNNVTPPNKNRNQENQGPTYNRAPPNYMPPSSSTANQPGTTHTNNNNTPYHEMQSQINQIDGSVYTPTIQVNPLMPQNQNNVYNQNQMYPPTQPSGGYEYYNQQAEYMNGVPLYPPQQSQLYTPQPQQPSYPPQTPPYPPQQSQQPYPPQTPPYPPQTPPYPSSQSQPYPSQTSLYPPQSYSPQPYPPQPYPSQAQPYPLQPYPQSYSPQPPSQNQLYPPQNQQPYQPQNQQPYPPQNQQPYQPQNQQPYQPQPQNQQPYQPQPQNQPHPPQNQYYPPQNQQYSPHSQSPQLKPHPQPQNQLHSQSQQPYKHNLSSQDNPPQSRTGARRPNIYSEMKKCSELCERYIEENQSKKGYEELERCHPGLHVAAGDVVGLQYHIDAGDPIVIVKDNDTKVSVPYLYGCIPEPLIHIASAYCKGKTLVSMLKTLKQYEADFKAKNYEKKTALHRLFENTVARKDIIEKEKLERYVKYTVEAIEILCDNGCPINARDKDGLTVLSYFLAEPKNNPNDKEHIITALLNKGANPNLPCTVKGTYRNDFYAPTALFLAVKYDWSTNIIKLMMQKGADARIWDDSKKMNILCLAVQEKKHALVKWLVEHILALSDPQSIKMAKRHDPSLVGKFKLSKSGSHRKLDSMNNIENYPETKSGLGDPEGPWDVKRGYVVKIDEK